MLDSRDDVGKLFENFMIIERFKYREYHAIYGDSYFFRTYDGNEVDLVEERAGKLYGYEFKWSATAGKKRNPPSKWQTYEEASLDYITPAKIKGFIF
jgi:hypothetical protein